MPVIEIEIGDQQNRNVFFAPLGRVLRGTFDLNREKEPTARTLSAKWPLTIPGIRLSLDAKSGVGMVRDPMHDEQHKAVAESIEKNKFSLGVAEERFEGVHIPSWLQQMKFAVDNGSARIVQGKFPNPLPGKPLRSYITPDIEDPTERQEKILDKLADALDKLSDVLTGFRT